jgi:superfamily II RNA helicase
MSWPLLNLIKKHERSSDESLNLFLDHVGGKGVSLYEAQEEAMLELASGKNLILNTPTGSGKSLVATFLHFDSLLRQKRSVYTSPIKALVNEKFLALCRDFGPETVGMITGDATVNPDARIICCTAEILSQLALRQGSEVPFADVIVDEFHYYSDRERGVAWQIPLLTLSKSRFLLMSATLGDSTFFEKEMTALNGLDSVTVKSTVRPVPLDFEYSERPLHFKIADLIAGNRYPVYLVNFTQRECAEEAQNLLSVDYCTKDEKRKIAEEMEGVDFRSPYGKDFQRLIKHGIGIHHGGLLPRYRVLVEKLAQKGLLKVICGTDTLGVGVNVPIRTVLFTKLCKYDGEKVGLLKVRDFQQISGRAGRKGFDDRGLVVVQAPEHVIENLILDQKAAADPKKAKKLVKKKPPEKGFISWNKETLLKLVESESEALVSRFKVDHAMILSVLSREGTVDCRALRELISRSHESLVMKKRHRRHAFQLFRSLLERNIISLNPLTLNVDLQEDFSLNHGLALFLIDTIKALDGGPPMGLPQDDRSSQNEGMDHALNVLTLVESILENPDLILRRQVDRLKTIRMEEMKREGLEYEERIAELEKVEHPKPNGEFIYDRFNEFARFHPWIGTENIRPKSVAREMVETFQSFHEYIREYGLERTEGLLLRYLSEVYKVLVQTVPEREKTPEIESIIEYFGEMLRGVDSSLVDEWERLRDPVALAEKNALRAEKEAREKDAVMEQERLVREEKRREFLIRNEVYRRIREISSGIALEQPIESALKEYRNDHDGPLLDQKARSPHFTRLVQTGEGVYQVEQTLRDREDYNDWVMVFKAVLTGTDQGVQVILELLRFGVID